MVVDQSLDLFSGYNDVDGFKPSTQSDMYHCTLASKLNAEKSSNK